MIELVSCLLLLDFLLMVRRMISSLIISLCLTSLPIFGSLQEDNPHFLISLFLYLACLMVEVDLSDMVKGGILVKWQTMGVG